MEQFNLFDKARYLKLNFPGSKFGKIFIGYKTVLGIQRFACFKSLLDTFRGGLHRFTWRGGGRRRLEKNKNYGFLLRRILVKKLIEGGTVTKGLP